LNEYEPLSKVTLRNQAKLIEIYEKEIDQLKKKIDKKETKQEEEETIIEPARKRSILDD